MFGTYRYLLAVMVMMAHLAPMGMVHTGLYAVTGFFTLSGYLMTMVLDTHYSKFPEGRKKYALNRVLRVMPAYWFVLLLSVFVAWYFPGTSLAVHERMQLPDSFMEWINNIIVIGLTGVVGDRSLHILVPPVWSLAVELVYWMLMPALLLTPRRYWGWGMCALIYTFCVIYWNAPLQLRYYALPAGALPFFLGAYVYREGQKRALVTPWKAVAIVLVSVAYYIFAPWLFEDARYDGEQWGESYVVTIGLYIALMLNAVTIHMLGRMDISALPRWLKKLDKGLGHIAYPVFLLHILAAVVVIRMMVQSLHCDAPACLRSWPLFWTSLPVVTIMAVILWFVVERPLIPLRRKVRNNAAIV